MKKIILGLILGIVLFPMAIYLYFRSGRTPVATSESPMPMERLLAKTSLHSRLRRDAPKTVPIRADEGTFLAGARVYRQDCAMCHGLPNQRPPAAGRGMFPRPPQLFQPYEMVTDDPGWSYLLEGEEWDSPIRHAGLSRLPLRRTTVAGKFVAGQCR